NRVESAVDSTLQFRDFRFFRRYTVFAFKFPEFSVVCSREILKVTLCRFQQKTAENSPYCGAYLFIVGLRREGLGLFTIEKKVLRHIARNHAVHKLIGERKWIRSSTVGLNSNDLKVGLLVAAAGHTKLPYGNIGGRGVFEFDLDPCFALAVGFCLEVNNLLALF